MCNHEESKQPSEANLGYNPTTAWALIDDQDGPIHMLNNLDSMLAICRMAVAHLNDGSGNMDLCQIFQMLTMAEEQLSHAHEKFEEVLSEVKISG